MLDFVPLLYFLPCICFANVRQCLRHLHCTPQCASPRSVSCVMSHYTRKPRPVKGRGNISETTCYCILALSASYAPALTRQNRQHLLNSFSLQLGSDLQQSVTRIRLPPSLIRFAFYEMPTVFVIVFYFLTAK